MDTEAAVPARVQEQAESLIRERFSSTDMEHPFVRTLADMGSLRLARRIQSDPDLLTSDPAEVSPPPVAGGKALDPVRILQKDTHLPSAPQVVLELQELIASETSSAADLAKVISKDVGLSALLLRMVNSAYYSFPSQVETIPRAVTLVGTGPLSTLAVGTSVLAEFKDIPGHMLDLDSFWRHSVACALLGREIAQLKKFPDAERFFVTGLLHDIGRLLIFKTVPELGANILEMSAHRKVPMLEMEQEIMGFSHAKLGSMLLRKWNFPFSIVMAVLNHHSPDKVADDPLALVTNLADFIAKGLGYGIGDRFYLSPLNLDCLKRVGVEAQDLEGLALALDQSLEDFLSLMH